jgi:hypothetical protein
MSVHRVEKITLRFRGVVDVATYASNKQTSIGRSGVDASRNVLSVASPPGLLSVQLEITLLCSLTYPAPITATRIAGMPSLPTIIM